MNWFLSAAIDSMIDYVDKVQAQMEIMPAQFRLIGKRVIVEDESTTVIPTTIVATNEGNYSVVCGRAIRDQLVHNLFMGGKLNLNDDTLDALDTNQNEYTIVTAVGREEIISVEAPFSSLTAGHNVFVYSEDKSCSLDITATTNIETATYPAYPGLSFAGCGILRVTAKQQGNTDLIVDIGGRKVIYHFVVAPAHTCDAPEWTIIWRPLEHTNGIEIKRCVTCGREYDVRFTVPCNEHRYGETETLALTKDGEQYLNYRICEECHYADMEIVDREGRACITVVFDANGGEGDMAALKNLRDEAVTLPENTFTMSGKQFAGWCPKPNGQDRIYADGAETTFSSSVTLYAMWSDNGKVDVDTGNVLQGDNTFIWNGTEQGIELPDWGECFTVTASGTIAATDVGEYTAELTFAADEAVYNPIAPVTVNWSILPAVNIVGQLNREYNGLKYNDTIVEAAVPANITLTWFTEDGEELEQEPVDAGAYLVHVSALLENGTEAEAETSFTITRRPLEVIMTGGTRVYDGTNDPVGSCAIKGIAQTDMVGSATPVMDVYTVGVHEEALDINNVTILSRRTGVDVTDNYELAVTKGTVTILPRALTITVPDAVCFYNKEEQGSNEEITVDGLADGDEMESLAISGAATEIGEYVGLLTPASTTIRNADEEDVTDCYDITIMPGTLRILPVPVQAIRLSATEVTMCIGESFEVVYDVLPLDATFRIPAITSGDERILKLDNGIMTAAASGTTTVTFAAVDGTGIAAECVVTVVDSLDNFGIPKNLMTINAETFMGIAMKQVDLRGHDDVTICEGAFDNCTRLCRLVLPERVTFNGGILDGSSSVVLFCATDEQADYAKEHGYAYVMTR